MAPLYARYVPPKSTATTVSNAPTVTAPSSPPPSKSKKEPKRKADGEEDGRKKRKRAEVESAPQDDTPSIPSKHSGLFDKFQKAARLSEVQKAAAKDQPVEAEDQPELHGTSQ